MSEHAERPWVLWMVVISPAIWGLHLLLSYATAAVWCAKVAGAGGPLGAARLAIAGYTAVALAGALATAVGGWRRHRSGRQPLPHDADTAADRHRFLGLATFLVSALSAVAIAYAGLTIVFIESCR